MLLNILLRGSCTLLIDVVVIMSNYLFTNSFTCLSPHINAAFLTVAAECHWAILLLLLISAKQEALLLNNDFSVTELLKTVRRREGIEE